MHRDLLKELNYLIFDTMYKNYYGDPDLALRVRDLGYKVIPCGTAWMENSNAFDEVEEIRREEDFDKDHKKFIERWASKFDVKSTDSATINRGKQMLAGGLPMEVCSRILAIINTGDYNELVDEMSMYETQHKYYFEKDYALNVFATIVSMGNKFPTFLKNRNYPISRELLKLTFENITESILVFKEIAHRVKYIQPDNIRNIVMVGYIMYLINKKRKNNDFVFIKHYKGTDIKYNGQFYDTTYNIKTETFAELIFKLDLLSNVFVKIDYLELNIFETYLEKKAVNFQNIFNALEYFINNKVNEKRQGKQNAYTWDAK